MTTSKNETKGFTGIVNAALRKMAQALDAGSSIDEKVSRRKEAICARVDSLAGAQL